MEFDWVGLEAFVVKQADAALRRQFRDSGNPISRVVVTDFYVRSMLVLWPALIVVGGDGRRVFDADSAADGWAADLTELAGSATNTWTTVIEQFFDSIVAACRRITRDWIHDSRTTDDFVAYAVDSERDLIPRCLDSAQLAAHFPLIHERRLAIAAIEQMTTDKQVVLLVDRLSAEESDSALTTRDYVQLLIPLGVAATDTCAAALADCVDAEPFLQVIDEIGYVSSATAAAVIAVIDDPSQGVIARRRAACSLALMGYLDEVVARADHGVCDDGLCEAMATPYLSSRKNGPLDYAPLERALKVRPQLHQPLFDRLSPAHIYPINGDDLATAVAGLSSPWPFVRRHAAIVMLSVHT